LIYRKADKWSLFGFFVWLDTGFWTFKGSGLGFGCDAGRIWGGGADYERNIIKAVKEIKSLIKGETKPFDEGFCMESNKMKISLSWRGRYSVLILIFSQK
jgi:hypothetical protein